MKSKFFITALAPLAVAGTVGLLNSPARLGVSGSGCSAPFGESARYAGAPREFNHGLTLGSAVCMVPRHVSVQDGRGGGRLRASPATGGRANSVYQLRPEAGGSPSPMAIASDLARCQMARLILSPAAGRACVKGGLVMATVLRASPPSTALHGEAEMARAVPWVLGKVGTLVPGNARLLRSEVRSGRPSGYRVAVLGFPVSGSSVPSPLPGLLAQVVNTSSLDNPIRSFLDFVQKILILPALALAVWSAWCFHENKIRDALLSLVGAFLCAAAVTIVKAIFGL